MCASTPLSFDLWLSNLIESMRSNPDGDAWRKVDRRVRPALYSRARRRGLEPEDAADVAQETLLCFYRQVRANRFDARRGSARRWIFGMLRHRILDHWRRVRRTESWRGDSVIVHVTDDRDDLEQHWTIESHVQALAAAIRGLRASTRTSEWKVRAFERIGRGDPPARVARDLGVTETDVYRARLDCVRRARRIVGPRSVSEYSREHRDRARSPVARSEEDPYQEKIR